MILCTSDPYKVDYRTRSKWSRALRFAAAYKDLDEPLRDFVRRRSFSFSTNRWSAAPPEVWGHRDRRRCDRSAWGERSRVSALGFRRHQSAVFILGDRAKTGAGTAVVPVLQVRRLDGGVGGELDGGRDRQRYSRRHCSGARRYGPNVAAPNGSSL